MKYYHKFPDIFLFKGASKGVIVDSTRNVFYDVPNALIDLINELGIHDLDSVLLELDADEVEIAHEYIQFIELHELAYSSNSSINVLFHDISEEIINPNLYDALIVNIDRDSNLNGVLNIISLACKISIRNICIVFHNTSKNHNLDSFVEALSVLEIENLDLIIPYKLFTMLWPFQASITLKLNSCVVYSVPSSNLIELSKGMTFTKFSTKPLGDILEGPIRKTDFITNLKYVIESKSFNPTFYRKVFVSSDGFMINHIFSSEKEFHISKITSQQNLKMTLKNDYFEKLARITKGTCEVCGLCEYHRICTDSRIPKINDSGKWYFEGNCAYNPLTGEWKS